MTSDRIALLAAGLTSFIALGAGMAITGAALPVYERMFALTTATAGLLVSTLWAGCLAGVVAMFFLSERVSPRGALSGIVLGAVLLAVAPNWPLTLIGAAVYGFGYGLVAAVFNPRLLVSWGASGPAKVSMLNAVFSGGAILAPWVFGLTGADPRPIFWAMAAIGAMGWALAWGTAETGKLRRAAARGFRPHLPILGFALVGIGSEASLAGLGPTALIRAGVAEDKAASLLALFFIAALVTRLGLIVLTRHLPDFAVYLGAVGWACLCALGAALISAPFFFPLMGVSAGLFFQGTFVPAVRKMGDDPRVPPLILGLGLVGASVGPLVIARAMDGLGSHGFFWLIAGVTGLATLAAGAAWRGIMR